MVSAGRFRVVLPLVVTLLVAGVAAGAVSAQVGPDDGRLTVTDVSVSPATPTVDEPVTLSVSLRNSAGSPSAVEVDRISLREVTDDEERELTRVSGPGTLSPGDTLTVPVTERFVEPGEYSLVLVAVGTDDDGNRTVVRRPVSLVVERAPPRLDVGVDRPVVGAESTVEVAVSNPTTVELRDVRLSVGGDVTGLSGGRTIPSLAAGDRVTVSLPVRPTEAGRQTLTVDATYASGSGVRASTEQSTVLRVAPAERDVGVRVAPAQQESDDQPLGGAVQGVLGGRTTQQDEAEEPLRRVDVTVTNFGNVPAREVVLTPGVGDDDLSRRAVPDLAPGESATVGVDLSTAERGAVDFRVTYRAAGESGAANATFDYRPPTGQIRLTGVDLAFEDGRLQITGNAGNVGGAPVDGVVVSVGSSATVEPAYPRRSYFVGTVDGSEFAPFELTADVDVENVSTVPVRLQYTVDGTEVERTVSVAFDDAIERESDGGGRPLLPYAVGGLALVVVVVGGLLLYGRRAGDG